MKLVVDFEQTGCEVKLNHSVGMTDRDNWREAFLLYERDLATQGDLEYLTEAVFVFWPSILTSSSGRMTSYGEISARRELTVMEMF